jgi:hypothetical protein
MVREETHMSSKHIPVSDDLLAEALAYAAAESKFKYELLINDIFISEDKITLEWSDPKWNKPKRYYDLGIKGYQRALVQTKAQLVKNAKEAANNIFYDVLNWIRNKFRKASDKLKVLAEKVLDLAKKFGISVGDVLARMRKFIFRWVIANSAMPSLVISDDKTSITLGLKNIMTSGSLEFGRVESGLNLIENIIGILKILPSISVKLDVEYSTDSQDQMHETKLTRKAKT